MNSFKLRCPCNTVLTAHASAIGKKAKCRNCEKVFTVPQPPPKKSPATVRPKKQPLLQKCESCNQDMNPGTVVCMLCGYHAKLQRRLDTTGVESTDLDTKITWLACAGGAISIIGISSMFLSQLDGPQFLVFYFCLFCFCAIATILARRFIQDTDIFNYSSLGTLLGMGVFRFFQSMFAGGHKFGFLFCGMAAAAILFGFSLTQIAASNDKDPPCADSHGRLSIAKFSIMFFVLASAIGSLFFIPAIGSAIGKATTMIAFGVSIFAFMAWAAYFGGDAESTLGGWGRSDCSSCSSCGGGCGGGCGGCGG